MFGALDAGLAPGLLPGRVTLTDGRASFAAAWGAVPAARGLDATGILQAAADGRIEVLVLLGADPLADFPDRALAERALERAGTVIAVDQFLTESSSQADVVLAAAGWAEVDGTTTNLEGRVLRLNQKVTPPGTARADWMIAAELAARLGGDLGFESTAAIAARAGRRSPRRTATSSSASDRDRGRGHVGAVRGRAAALPPAAAGRRRCAWPWPAKLYDGATLTQQSPSLAHLAPRAQRAPAPRGLPRPRVPDGAPVTSARPPDSSRCRRWRTATSAGAPWCWWRTCPGRR